MKTKIIALTILVLLTACSKDPSVSDKKVVTAKGATILSLTSFIANWEALTGATGYFLDVATDLSFDSLVSGFNNLSVATTSSTVTGLAEGTFYYYRVRATTAGGTTENSLTITVMLRPTVWFFGDSMTEGIGASSPENRWTTKLCSQKYWQEANKGTSYETLITASENTGYTHFFEKYANEIRTKPALGKYIFIAYGGNDCAFNFADYTPELFSTQLQTIITFANSKGWTNTSIVVLCGYFENDASWSAGYGGQDVPAATMTRYNSFITAAQTVAANNAGVYFVNPFDTYDETGMSDAVHANDKGHAAIAEYVASKIP